LLAIKRSVTVLTTASHCS